MATALTSAAPNKGANEILNDRKLHKYNSAVIHLQNTIVPVSHANIISNFITTDWCVVCKISFFVFWFSMFIFSDIQLDYIQLVKTVPIVFFSLALTLLLHVGVNCNSATSWEFMIQQH